MLQTFYKGKLFFLIIGVFCIILVLTGVLVVIKGQRSTSITPEPVSGTKQVVTEAVRDVIASKAATVKIGNDTFNRSDLEQVARLNVDGKKLSSMTATEQAQLSAVVTERSVVLQEAKKQGFIKVDDSLLGPGKNMGTYEAAYVKAAQSVIDQSEKISVKGILIFFYNTTPPKMGVEQAKQFTRTKMEKYHEDLVSGKITIDQAAESIQKDTSLAEVDSIYKENAFVKVVDATKDYSVVVPGLRAEDNTKLWNMKVGDISPVFLGSEGGHSDVSGTLLPSVESYWAIFEVTDKHGTGPSYLTWLQNAEKQYVQN